MVQEVDQQAKLNRDPSSSVSEFKPAELGTFSATSPAGTRSRYSTYNTVVTTAFSGVPLHTSYRDLAMIEC